MIKSIVFDFNGVILDTSTHDADTEMIDLIQDLFVLGLKLHIFSNTSRSTILKLDSKHDFLKYFDKIILAEETGFSKPYDEAYDNLLKITGEKVEEMICVDDGRDNLRQGKKYGMESLLFINPHRLRTDLTKFGI